VGDEDKYENLEVVQTLNSIAMLAEKTELFACPLYYIRGNTSANLKYTAKICNIVQAFSTP